MNKLIRFFGTAQQLGLYQITPLSFELREHSKLTAKFSASSPNKAIERVRAMLSRVPVNILVAML